MLIGTRDLAFNKKKTKKKKLKQEQHTTYVTVVRFLLPSPLG